VTLSAMSQTQQSSPALRRESVQSLLIVRLSAMGDVIHALPAVAALRRARPALRIGWLIEERWRELLCSRESENDAPVSQLKPLVDTVHMANFAAWRRAMLSDETWREARVCFRDISSRKYDAVLDLQGAIRSAIAARISGASRRIGSSQPREAPARLFYTRAITPTGAHVVEHALSLASSLAEEKLEYVPPAFPCDPIHEAWAEKFLASFDGKPVVIMNPGAGWGAKCWPSESFGAVALRLHERGFALLINHGPGEEPLAEAVRHGSGDTARLLKCSVAELIAITRRARLFIGGDTGPMHLAAALNVPVVALFGPTRPERNGPYGTRSIVLRKPESAYSLSHAAEPDRALATITPQEVIDAAQQLLGAAHG
jgi:heptosyltransferase-1